MVSSNSTPDKSRESHASAMFRVDLDIFRGPIDLLLYLVRKHEVEITDIPISAIAEQFIGHLEVIEQIDVNKVGDFLEMASNIKNVIKPFTIIKSGPKSKPFKIIVSYFDKI